MIDYFEDRWTRDGVTYNIRTGDVGTNPEKAAVIGREGMSGKVVGTIADASRVAANGAGIFGKFDGDTFDGLSGNVIGVIDAKDATTMEFYNCDLTTQLGVTWTRVSRGG